MVAVDVTALAYFATTLNGKKRFLNSGCFFIILKIFSYIESFLWHNDFQYNYVYHSDNT